MSNSALVDVTNDNKPGDLDALKKDLAEAVTRPAESPAAEAKPEPTEPEKYRGKSREEIMEMHMNAERKIGKTGNELGQYKQLTDQLLDLKRRDDLARGGAEIEEEEEPLPKIKQEDIFDDPDAAIAKAVEARLARAERQKAREREKTELEHLQQEFVRRHPDYQEIAEDPAFNEFVSKSQSRQMLAAAALQAGNLYAANALLDEYKSARQSAPEEKAPAKENNLEAARRAATVSTGTSTASDAPQGKTYRRLDLIRLKLEDPEAYGSEAFQQEIMKAYAEGRVI